MTESFAELDAKAYVSAVVADDDVWLLVWRERPDWKG
jgi:hypothetical protein